MDEPAYYEQKKPLPLVAKITREIAVPLFEDDRIVVCGTDTNWISYLASCGLQPRKLYRHDAEGHIMGTPASDDAAE